MKLMRIIPLRGVVGFQALSGVIEPRVSLEDAFPQRLKPVSFRGSYGAAEAVPFQSRFKLTHYALSRKLAQPFTTKTTKVHEGEARTLHMKAKASHHFTPAEAC